MLVVSGERVINLIVLFYKSVISRYQYHDYCIFIKGISSFYNHDNACTLLFMLVILYFG